MKKYDTVMQDLMDQYNRAWERVQEEERNMGVVSEEAEQILMTIELEMEMLQNAV